jgi:uroporphyrinogen-III synthase
VPTAPTIFLADGLRDGVLITRAEEAARETGALVHAMGLRPVLAPLSTIVPLAAAFPPPDRVQAVLVTSGNAIPGLPQAYRRVPLLAVGDATARLAEAAGFADVRSASGDAEALAAMTQSQCEPGGKPLVLATGEGQGGALASALRALGFAVLRRVAYAARPVDALPESARMALARGGLRAALFFSTEGARVFVRLFGQCLDPATVSQVDALAISRSTEAALAPLPWQHIHVASHPNQDELLALLR